MFPQLMRTLAACQRQKTAKITNKSDVKPWKTKIGTIPTSKFDFFPPFTKPISKKSSWHSQKNGGLIGYLATRKCAEHMVRRCHIHYPSWTHPLKKSLQKRYKKPKVTKPVFFRRVSDSCSSGGREFSVLFEFSQQVFYFAGSPWSGDDRSNL